MCHSWISAQHDIVLLRVGSYLYQKVISFYKAIEITSWGSAVPQRERPLRALRALRVLRVLRVLRGYAFRVRFPWPLNDK